MPTIESVREEWSKDHARALPLNALAGIEQAFRGSVSLEQMTDAVRSLKGA
jgi:hypothetical protein